MPLSFRRFSADTDSKRMCYAVDRRTLLEYENGTGSNLLLIVGKAG